MHERDDVPKHFRARQRQQLFSGIVSELQKGRQVYFVYPLIDENEKLDLLALEQGYEAVVEAFHPWKVGKVHGRMKPAEKEEAMRAFAANETQILVSTTVVEVGVNIPNACLMIIENAERFGLSQLHQLRGRVGRGNRKSYCILVAGEGAGEKALERLHVLAANYDGYAIAEADLKERGPGDFLALNETGSVRQSGGLSFRLADAGADLSTLVTATEDAKALLHADPALASHPLLKGAVEEAFTLQTGYLN